MLSAQVKTAISAKAERKDGRWMIALCFICVESKTPFLPVPGLGPTLLLPPPSGCNIFRMNSLKGKTISLDEHERVRSSRKRRNEKPSMAAHDIVVGFNPKRIELAAMIVMGEAEAEGLRLYQQLQEEQPNLMFVRPEMRTAYRFLRFWYNRKRLADATGAP